MPRVHPGRLVGLGLTAALLASAVACTGDKPEPPAPSASQPPAGPDYSLGRSEPVADPLYPDYGNPDIDVLHYGLALDYDPSAKLLKGVATLSIRPVKTGADIRLDFDSGLKISAATVDGTAVTAVQQGQDLTLPAAVTADKNVEVVITYEGEPHPADAPMERSDYDEGVGATIEDDGSLWTMQEPFGAFTWYPVNDHPSDEALYDFTITVPEGYSGVANGKYEGREGNTFKWHSASPIASYVTTIGVDKYELIEEKGPHDLPLTYWVPEKWVEKWTPALKRSPEIVEWLEDRYGPYPFDSLGVLVVGGESAMETQQMVTFSGGLIDDPRGGGEDYIVETLAHEFSHQWFGDSVSPADWKSVWLNEGMAMYTQGQWIVKETKGVTEKRVYEEVWREQDQKLRDKHGPPGDYKADDFASSNVYICPAVMLYEIRQEIGDDKFEDMMRDWAQQKDTHQDRTSFTAWVSKYAGKDMTAFVDEWLDSDKTPK